MSHLDDKIAEFLSELKYDFFLLPASFNQVVQTETIDMWHL